MLRYVAAWAPAVVVVGTAVILTSAYLALIVVMLVVFVAVPVLAGAVVAAPYLLVRALYRSWPDLPQRAPADVTSVSRTSPVKGEQR